MTSLIVAKRYAKALLTIGRDDGKIEQYGQELTQVADLFASSPELVSALATPAFDFEDRRKLLQTFLKKLGLSPMVDNFFSLLMDRGRIAATADIAMVYGRLVDEVKGITRAEVSTATALNEEETKRLTEALKKLAGRDVEVEVKEDPSLIGGIRARIGDLVLDGSVKTQLASLKESLGKGDYA